MSCQSIVIRNDEEYLEIKDTIPDFIDEKYDKIIFSTSFPYFPCLRFMEIPSSIKYLEIFSIYGLEIKSFPPKVFPRLKELLIIDSSGSIIHNSSFDFITERL